MLLCHFLGGFYIKTVMTFFIINIDLMQYLISRLTNHSIQLNQICVIMITLLDVTIFSKGSKVENCVAFEQMSSSIPLLNMVIYFKSIATKTLKNVCDFLNFIIFVREYRTRRSGTSHSEERYVTKPQTSHNNMQKTIP